ncbi:MAG: hypothetical protein ACUVSV_04250 [Armatimonadota bacterium]
MFAFLVALVVWVMGNAVVTVYQAKAQDVGAGMATGLPFRGAVSVQKITSLTWWTTVP